MSFLLAFAELANAFAGPHWNAIFLSPVTLNTICSRQPNINLVFTLMRCFAAVLAMQISLRALPD